MRLLAFITTLALVTAPRAYVVNAGVLSSTEQGMNATCALQVNSAVGNLFVSFHAVAVMD